MKKIKLLSIITVFFALIINVNSQIVEQDAIASKMFYFNSGGLIGNTPELLSQGSDSNCYAVSYSMKTLTVLDGVYYHALGSTKFEADIQKTALRKSNDGVNWSALVNAGDSPGGIVESYQNIHVWKKNNSVHVGIIFMDRRSGIDQVRFVKSTNGGASFLPSVQVSSHPSGGDFFQGGVTGKGDTIAVCWTKLGAQTMFSISVDGGVTWSTMTQVFSGGFFSIVTDITMDNSGNLYTVIAEDQIFKVNLIVRKSANLGTSWTPGTAITNVSIQQMNQFQQCKFFNNKLYVMWERNMNTSSHLSDGIFLTESSNGASSWSAPVDITDTDTLYESSVNFPLEMHPSFTATPGGVMYAVWADSRAGNSQTFDSCRFNIYLSRSTNGGASWGQNILVNGPSNYPRIYNRYADISVKSTGGTDSVLVTWTKRRDISVIGIIQTGTEVPESFSLSQNYPNPFNPVTKIRYQIPDNNTFVSLKIYDANGKTIEIIINEVQNAGMYEADFDGSNLASGVYFCRLESSGVTQSRKMILLK